MPRYIAAIDQGTTSTRCILFDRSGPVGWAQKEHRQIYPRPGDIAAVGITNQRETTVVWDRRTGRPLCHAIVWQDTRTKEICDELARTGGMDRFRPITGLPLATYFPGPKLRWILENVPGTRRAACHRSDPCVADDADESADAVKTPARSMRTRMSAPPGLTVRPVFGQTRV